MTYIPWADHREHRLELSASPDCDGVGGGSPAMATRPGEGCLLITAGDFHLPLHRLGEFVATLYEAAGKPAPAVLDLPRLDGTESRHLWGTTFSVSHYPGNVRFGADQPGGHMLNMRPGEARALAGILMAYADAAAEAPRADPAEVEALAEVLHRVRERCDGAGEWDRRDALAVLAAGYTPPRGET